MSFQDIQHGSNPPSRRTQSPSQAVAAGIFQINTAVGTFRRLVDSVGTVKDTPEHRQKLYSIYVSFLFIFIYFLCRLFDFVVIVVAVFGLVGIIQDRGYRSL